MNTTAKVITGFLAGASLGILTGILIAPKSGKKTRDALMSKGKDLKNKVAEKYYDARKTYNSKIDELAKEGKSTLDSLKQHVKV
ncbi:MAG TPA: YtxH domain-containing protein [Cyclobacteriaceae bacterium]|nr:YtxH domain-containing protein [Cyclobacteriaceae bacterium]